MVPNTGHGLFPGRVGSARSDCFSPTQKDPGAEHRESEHGHAGKRNGGIEFLAQLPELGFRPLPAQFLFKIWDGHAQIYGIENWRVSNGASYCARAPGRFRGRGSG
jgi:hypothetical protein